VPEWVIGFMGEMRDSLMRPKTHPRGFLGCFGEEVLEEVGFLSW